VALRDQLLAEIAGLDHSDDLALSTYRRLPARARLPTSPDTGSLASP
jgi:hypothetical protein